MSVASCWPASGCSSPLGNSRTQPTLPKAMLSPHQFGMRRGLWLLFPSEKLKPCHQLHRWVAAGVMKSLGQPHVKCAPILSRPMVAIHKWTTFWRCLFLCVNRLTREAWLSLCSDRSSCLWRLWFLTHHSSNLPT